MESGSVTISLTQAPVEIRPLTGRIGAELPGLDLTEVDDEAVAAIRTALLAHKVLFFRDQRLDPESHRAFAARFGPLTKAHPEFGGDTMWANTVAAYERLPESSGDWPTASERSTPTPMTTPAGPCLAVWDNRSTQHHALVSKPGDGR